MATNDYKSLTLKWRLFRLANYLLIACVLGFTGLLIYGLSGKGYIPADAIFNYFLAFASAAIMLTNYCSNLYLLERCYPQSEISYSYRLLIGVLHLLTSVIIAFVTLTFAYLLHEEITESTQVSIDTTRSRIITAAFGMILLITYYVTWQQVALRRTIQRNHRRLYNAFLEPNQK